MRIPVAACIGLWIHWTNCEQRSENPLDIFCFALTPAFLQHIGHSTLVVTHGDTVNAAGQLFLGDSKVLYDTQECCWVVFDHTAKLIESARCQVLHVDE